MSTESEGFLSHDYDGPKLPEGLLERALAGPGDPRRNTALLELIRLMLPYATNLIRAAFDETNPRRERAPTTVQMRELHQAHCNPLHDGRPGGGESMDRAIEAAMVSAAESFLGHWAGEFANIRSPHDLALNLIRITYNRHQRRRRADARLSRQARSGNGAHAEGSYLVSRADGRQDPASEAELHDFLELRRCLDDGILGGFSVRDRQIIYLLVTGHSRDEIVALVNRHGNRRAACTLNTVNHVIETFQAQLERLEDEDEGDEEGRPNPRETTDDDRDAEPRRDGAHPRPPQEPSSG